jgi:hypothetical protein
VWYCALLAIFFLWLWGDNYRYLAFVSLPTSILSAQLLLTLIPTLFIVPPLAISSLVIYRNTMNFIEYPNYSDLGEIKFPENSKILVFPTRLVYATAYYSNQKTICGALARALTFELEELTPIVKRDISLFLSKYDVTHVFIDKTQSEIIKNIPKDFHKKAEIMDHVLYEKTASAI